MLNTVLGGFIALAGVALAQWWQSKRVREDAALRRATEKAARLRGAYQEVVASADWLRSRALELVNVAADVKKHEEWMELVDVLTEPDRSISAARASLLLEADDEDRDALEAFAAVRMADATLKLALITHWMHPPEKKLELFEALAELEGAVDDVVGLARGRLRALEVSDARP